MNPPVKRYKISEIMEFGGLSRQTVHNWTCMGLITEAARTPSGYRLYDEEVFERIERIKELRKTKSLKEIKRILGGRTDGAA